MQRMIQPLRIDLTTIMISNSAKKAAMYIMMSMNILTGSVDLEIPILTMILIGMTLSLLIEEPM